MTFTTEADHLAMMTSPGWAAQRPDCAEALRGSGQTLHLHASDEPNLGEAGEWFVERGTEEATWQLCFSLSCPALPRLGTRTPWS
jgi:hypothetical protein